ncbi:MAG: hypothetical protein ACOC85_04910, partial [Thermoplasmatota archaeon]
IEQTRYNNITIKIDNQVVLERDETFGLEYRTNLTFFKLSVDAYRANKRYHFNATFIVSQEEDIIYEVVYPDNTARKIKLGNLPFRENLQLMEEE